MLYRELPSWTGPADSANIVPCGRDEKNRTSITRLSDAVPTIERHHDIWSRIRDLNSHQQFGRLLCCHYTNATYWWQEWELNPCNRDYEPRLETSILPAILEQVTRIELASRPWQGRVLPLYDTCISGTHIRTWTRTSSFGDCRATITPCGYFWYSVEDSNL